jgi:isoamylase
VQVFENSPGFPFPFGATFIENHVNFAITTKSGNSVSLCLFEPNTKNLVSEIVLDPLVNKTGSVWHILVHHIKANYLYAYKINGINDPLKRNRFNPKKLLLDPYAKTVSTTNVWGDNSLIGANYLPLGVIAENVVFNWEGVKNPLIPLKDLIIYEMHTRGFTNHSSSKVEHPGKFLGIIEKIPYLIDLGINAIELMPIHEFNELDTTLINPINNEKLVNYWGYSSVNFFSPMNRYISSDNYQDSIAEFKKMVKALHENGIEVLLDIVFNHTGEGNDKGQTLSFRGIDNATYYILQENGEYANYTGCGNTFNCNHPISIELIVNSLRYYVTEMHVDGFRFDLASIFTRNSLGIPIGYGPLLEALTEDPILSSAKLIAEPWDAAGLYQVGGFVPDKIRWSEWNGKYRDSVRRFIKGELQAKGEFATRLSGSQDLYDARSPLSSINFVTAHDGFTLSDLVSYNQKHNIENGEENQDGSDANWSWNCGIEGASTNPKVINLRKKQMKNFHLALMVSQGIPMILMGDEYGHTKKGNNNTWCQDNNLNWYNWDTLQDNSEFYRFYKGLIHFRKKHSLLKSPFFLTSTEIEWHGIDPYKPNWDAPEQFLAFLLKDPECKNDLYVAFNAQDKAVTVHLPKISKDSRWHMIVNSAAQSPDDFFEEDMAPLLTTSAWRLPSHAAILLKSLRIQDYN